MALADIPIDIVEYGFGVTFSAPNLTVLCPYCEDPSSKSPSCSVSSEGVFKCHGKCGASGNVYDFFAKCNGLLPYEAEEALNAKDPSKRVVQAVVISRPRIDQLSDDAVRDMIQRAHDTLYKATNSQKRDKANEFRRYLEIERGLTERTIIDYEIGCDEQRITIPVYWRDEVPGIRRYLPHADKGKKIRPNTRANTRTRLYPERRMLDMAETESEDGDFVILCEGEWDCLLLNQLGYYAITTTAGVTNWRMEWYDDIIDCIGDRSLVIMFDVNDKQDVGQTVARRRAMDFALRNIDTYVAILPIEDKGGDVTDFIVKHKKTRVDLDAVIHTAMQARVTSGTYNDSQMTLANVVEDDDDSVTLVDALESRSSSTEVKVKALVVAKSDSPYRVPSHIEFTWEADDSANGSSRSKSVLKIPKDDGRLISLLGIEADKQHTLLRGFAGVPRKAEGVVCRVLEYTTIEELYISPELAEMASPADKHTPIAYSVGLGVAPNTPYRFVGRAIPKPKDQHSTFLFWRAEQSESDIDTFDLTDEECEDLSVLFSPVYNGVVNIERKMHDIAEDHALYRSRIFGREDVHTLVDLAYHSPLRFSYGGERAVRGRLDVGIFGSTRLGKTETAMSLRDHYHAGGMMNLEGTTVVGVIGGIKKINGNHVLTPGRMPMAHRRLLICDEMNQLSTFQIGGLTGVRSSGEVIIDKVVHGHFPAETRLVWLSNPRADERRTSIGVESYRYGIEMVKDLVGDDADIARFDVVLIVAEADVTEETINRCRRVRPSEPSAYTSEACHKLVMWVWSRQPEHIQFTDEAVALVYKFAKILSQKFHQSIPLLIGTEVRHKIARLAAAAAGRTFSTKDGIHLIVLEDHVKFAFNFLHQVYTKDCCQFDAYSESRFADERLDNPSELDKLLPSSRLATFGKYALDTRQMTRDGIGIAANLDFYEVNGFIHSLLKHNAVRMYGTGYTKTIAFKNYLDARRRSLAPKEHITQEDDT
jgi:hypothetical protein